MAKKNILITISLGVLILLFSQLDFFYGKNEYKDFFEFGSRVYELVDTQLNTEVDSQKVLGEMSGKSNHNSGETQYDVSSLKDQAVYEVSGISDGDTIKVLLDGKVETIRIVNINTPETVDPRKSVECMGIEASEKMKELVANKSVRLMIDETQATKDRYGRLLRFVFLEDGTDVGLRMISSGLANSSPYGSFPHVFFDTYESAENKAKELQIGVWNPDSCK